MDKIHKIIFIITCLIFIVDPCHSQIPPYNKLGGFLYSYKENKFYWGLSFNLNGKIKSIEQKKYRLISKSGKLVRGRFIQSDKESNKYLKYDAFGNVIESNYHNSSSRDKIKKYINKYDDHENLVEIKVYASTGTLDAIYTNVYDENNNLIEVNGHNSKGELFNIKKYTYNDIGNIIEKELFLGSNTYKKYTYNYDEDNNLIEIFYTNLNSNDLSDVIFQIAFEATLYFAFDIEPVDPYDPLLNPVYGEETNKPKNVYLRIERKYDDHKNVNEEAIYNIEYEKHPGGLIEKYNCEYDDNGNIVKELRTLFIYSGSSIELYHKYDENGYKIETNLIYNRYDIKTEIKSTILNDTEGKVIEIIENLKNNFNKVKYSETFEYDSNNNVSKIYFFKKGKPKYVIERKIEYY